jgi:hypothetical protein
MKNIRKIYRESPTQKWFSLDLLPLLLTPIFLFAPIAFAQQLEEQKGIDQGNYNIKQSIEFGGRLTTVTGNEQTYDTMVNLQQGPRLLNFTTEMRSLDHRGTFFDRLYFSNFGYGGDPNVVSILRISKNKWYLFDASFRHDENFWDYSLLANPYNQIGAVANAPANYNPIVNAPPNVLNTQIIATSPHTYNTRRNMQNYGLTVLPDSKVRLRLGHSHNTTHGPAFDTLHQGTEQFLLQNLSATMNQYRLGVDFRFLPRTNISYDQTWSYYKTDPGITDENQQFSVGGGFPPVDLGVTWSPQPCSPTFNPGSIVNPTCSAYYNYFSHRQSRLHAPTEQVSLQSTFFPTLQLSGKYSYTGSDFNVYNYQQAFQGLESRSFLSNFLQTGPMQGRHTASYADFGATWQITRDFSLVDSFHYGNWQEPAQFTASECSFFSSSLIIPPNFFTSAAALPVSTCTPPANAVPGTPNHKSGSAPDILVNLDSNFLKQSITSNLIEGQVQISPMAGAYFGYRYVHRVIADNFYNTQNAIYFPSNAARGNCALVSGVLPDGCTQNADGSISFVTPNPSYGPPGVTDIDSNTAVLGLWAKPAQRVFLNFDAEVGSANKTFTQLSPRDFQQVRARLRYQAASKVSLSLYFMTQNGQNNAVTVNGSGHDTNAGMSLSIAPSEKISAQLGYNYDNISSSLLICFTSSLAQPGLQPCPNVEGLVQQQSPYSSAVNTGFVDVLWSPTPRLSVEAGGNLSSASGTQLQVNPLSTIATIPTGPLDSTWYQPYGSIGYRFAKHWAGRARWDYYSYRENLNNSYQDFYAPRSFHSNLITLSVRFAF